MANKKSLPATSKNEMPVLDQGAEGGDMTAAEVLDDVPSPTIWPAVGEEASEWGSVLRFGADVTLKDFCIAPSSDRQHLLIYCQRKLVAFCSAIGGDVQRFELADGARYSLTDLLERIALTEAGEVGVPD